MLEGMSNAARGRFLNTMEMTNPEAFSALRDYIGAQRTAMLQTRIVPEPSALGSAKNPTITTPPTTYEKGIVPKNLPNK